MDTFGPHEDTCAARHAPGGRSDDILDHHYDSGPEFAEDYAEGDEALSGLGLGNDLSDPAPRPDADPPLPAALLEATGTNKAGTNVVERGVDEPDVVKVDGTRLLRLWGFLPPGADGADPAQPVDEWQLSVLGAGADRPRLLGSVGPRERHVAHELFLLSDHRVLVLGSVTQRSPRRGDRPDTPKVVLTLLDTADAVAPQVLRTAKVTGRYVSARMTDGVVRVVLATSAPIEVSAPVGREPRVLAEVRNTGMLHRYKGIDWLPGREILDSHGDLVAEGPAMACSDVHRPAAPRSPDLLSVLTVDSLDGVDALDRAGGSALVGGGDTCTPAPTASTSRRRGPTRATGIPRTGCSVATGPPCTRST